MDKLGKISETSRGFSCVEFEDFYNKKCSLQCSSIVLDYDDAFDNPGSSGVWLGIDDPEPVVMAVVAAKLGVETNQTVGWVPYPIPDEVSLHTRMHLNREQVAGLIDRLQDWLDNGELNENDDAA